ncbi:hypothetical protein [Streptomyces chartreusis]|uniref:hypothetical protein n=1 Tax=Streptomyces chartreusis TaxID=1969 RepID=UPI002F9126AC|nr:hypothetical protein OG938_47465 [Streptomyces chartreusis]WTA33677.1 hypothetical protein OIA45_48045 [Streptomyces chartreusis]
MAASGPVERLLRWPRLLPVVVMPDLALRVVCDGCAADAVRQDFCFCRFLPSAAAVVAVTRTGWPLTLAWCGDGRACLLQRGIVRRLTEEHSLRRVYPPTATFPDGGNRNVITSCLGGPATDEDARNEYNYPVIETSTVQLTGPACFWHPTAPTSRTRRQTTTCKSNPTKTH